MEWETNVFLFQIETERRSKMESRITQVITAEVATKYRTRTFIVTACRY